jgi:hypothetical protein
MYEKWVSYVQQLLKPNLQKYKQSKKHYNTISHKTRELDQAWQNNISLVYTFKYLISYNNNKCNLKYMSDRFRNVISMTINIYVMHLTSFLLCLYFCFILLWRLHKCSQYYAQIRRYCHGLGQAVIFWWYIQYQMQTTDLHRLLINWWTNTARNILTRIQN